MVRDGRILDVLPHRRGRRALFGARRAGSARSPRCCRDWSMREPVSRPWAPSRRAQGFWADGALLCIANMLKAGITCFCEAGYFPREVARDGGRTGPARRDRAAGRGASERLGAKLRRIPHTRAAAARRIQGPPVDLDRASRPSARARSAMTPSRVSRSWPRSSMPASSLSLHESRHAVEASLRHRGKRPLQRFQDLGLLSPARDRRARHPPRFRRPRSLAPLRRRRHALPRVRARARSGPAAGRGALRSTGAREYRQRRGIRRPGSGLMVGNQAHGAALARREPGQRARRRHPRRRGRARARVARSARSRPASGRTCAASICRVRRRSRRAIRCGSWCSPADATW